MRRASTASGRADLAHVLLPCVDERLVVPARAVALHRAPDEIPPSHARGTGGGDCGGIEPREDEVPEALLRRAQLCATGQVVPLARVCIEVEQARVVAVDVDVLPASAAH